MEGRYYNPHFTDEGKLNANWLRLWSYNQNVRSWEIWMWSSYSNGFIYIFLKYHSDLKCDCLVVHENKILKKEFESDIIVLAKYVLIVAHTG